MSPGARRAVGYGWDGVKLERPSRRVETGPTYGIPAGSKGRTRRMVTRTAALAGSALLVAVIASVGWAFFGGTGSGSAPFSADVAQGSQCIPLQGTSADAITLLPSQAATASSTYNGNDCTLSFLFGIPKGDTGAQGPAGADSTVPGPAGPAGADGAVGPAGPTGAAGSNGSNGVSATTSSGAGSCATGGITVHSASPDVEVCNGAVGATGAKGDTGATGSQGIQGIQGPPGTNGTNGTNGVSGFQVVTNTRSCGNATINGICTVTVSCPGSKVAVGGGGKTQALNTQSATTQSSFPSDASGNPVSAGTSAPAWTVNFIGFQSGTGSFNNLVVFAECVTAS